MQKANRVGWPFPFIGPVRQEFSSSAPKPFSKTTPQRLDGLRG
jgi:hypothetical protein